MKSITMKSINSRTGKYFSWTAPNNTIMITPQEAAQKLVAQFPDAMISKNVMNLLKAV